MTLRAAALLPQPHTVLDHLGVLAAILKIPLIIEDQETYSLAAVYYPQVKIFMMRENELSLEYLAANYDALFVSSKLWAIQLYPLFPLLCQKKMRIVYCPHGNSDKGHTLTKEFHQPEDVALVYGDHMTDLLKDTGMDDKINRMIPTGNYRYSFFRRHQAFYRKLAYEKIFSKLDKTKKTILYAPTWDSAESPSSFFQECSALIDQITPPFNLLIKVHPYFYNRDLVKTTVIYEKYKDHPQVLFLENFPPIYPLLSLSDAYLGDFSSIGYDFLRFDRPMYFFNPSNTDLKKDRGRFLHRCGMEISTKTDENVFDFIARTLEQNRLQFSPIRKKIYAYAFGKERKLSELRRDIFANLGN